MVHYGFLFILVESSGLKFLNYLLFIFNVFYLGLLVFEIDMQEMNLKIDCFHQFWDRDFFVFIIFIAFN